jgi:hypothetical protein
MTASCFEMMESFIITLVLFVLIYVNLPEKISDDRDKNKIDKKDHPK